MRGRLRPALTALALGAGVLSVGTLSSPAAAAPAPAQTEASDAAPPEAAEPAPDTSDTVWRFADWVTASKDNEDLPFAILDKVQATVFVFSPDGRLTGAAPVLLGVALGDDSAPGVGDHAQLSTIPPEQRTTPAGRFVAAFGPSIDAQEVLWVDYETAVSMHHVLTDVPKERRLERLRSPTPEDNRITYGCINVPDDFYEQVVRPTFTGTKGVVYVLPEVRELQEVFPDFETKRRRSLFGILRL